MDILDDLGNVERCRQLSQPSIPQFVVSCLLMGWLLISYAPQWVRIIGRKSAEGLSTLYILLGSLSGVCAVGNILMLPSSEVDMACCRTNSGFACLSGLLGMLQVIFGITCFWVVLFMYVYYSEEEADAEIHGRRPSLSGPERTLQRARRALFVLVAVCVFAMTVLLVSAIILSRFPWYAEDWADILGIAVAALACAQWVPQIRTTWRLGDLGSLSLVSLCLSAPYTWIFGTNMIIRVGLKGWSAWIVYLLVGMMQLVLIVTGIFFLIRDRRRPREVKLRNNVHLYFRGWNQSGRSIASSNIAPDERRSLLPKQPSSNDHLRRPDLSERPASDDQMLSPHRR
ncbi:hypothetical protein BJ170DRAFT_600541 [Xylariales sp. AK1849]|nr:hypothetical protein BJ170DRAFT_600541 [Xylariales sp. AK1849]